MECRVNNTGENRSKPQTVYVSRQKWRYITLSSPYTIRANLVFPKYETAFKRNENKIRSCSGQTMEKISASIVSTLYFFSSAPARTADQTVIGGYTYPIGYRTVPKSGDNTVIRSTSWSVMPTMRYKRIAAQQIPPGICFINHDNTLILRFYRPGYDEPAERTVENTPSDTVIYAWCGHEHLPVPTSCAQESHQEKLQHLLFQPYNNGLLSRKERRTRRWVGSKETDCPRTWTH